MNAAKINGKVNGSFFDHFALANQPIFFGSQA